VGQSRNCNRSHPSQEFEVARAPAFVIAACE